VKRENSGIQVHGEPLNNLINSVHGKEKERGVILSLENNIIRKFYEVIWSLSK